MDAAEKIEVTVEPGDPVVVRVAGRIALDTVPPLREALAVTGHPRIVVDLSAVPMCDSSGLNLLVRTCSRVTAEGGWLRLAGVQPLVAAVLDITNLTRMLPVYRTAAEAAGD